MLVRPDLEEEPPGKGGECPSGPEECTDALAPLVAGQGQCGQWPCRCGELALITVALGAWQGTGPLFCMEAKPPGLSVGWAAQGCLEVTREDSYKQYCLEKWAVHTSCSRKA